MRLAKDEIELASSSGQSATVRKGELILVANMAAHYDDDCFEGADEFRPNRFVQADGTFASSSHLRVWGAGQGICKGRVFAQFNEVRHFARAVLTLAQFWLIVRMLETFDISFVGLEKTAGTKIVDSTGATIVLPEEQPGRGGSGTATPMEGFTVELRMRAD